jgi:hypothetical protein
LPELAPANFFLFPRVKRDLAGQTLTQEALKKQLEGAVRTLFEADFAMAFRLWCQHHKKCVKIADAMSRKTKNTKMP